MNKKPSIALECYVKKGNKFLMLHRNVYKRILPNVWMAPGGHLEPGEGVFACARREIMEETGLRIKNLKLKSVGVGTLQDLNLDVYFYFITADYAGGKVHEEPENGELKWLTLEEILKLDNLLAELKIVLPFVLDPNHPVISYTAVYDKGNHMTHFNLESTI